MDKKVLHKDEILIIIKEMFIFLFFLTIISIFEHEMSNDDLTKNATERHKFMHC